METLEISGASALVSCTDGKERTPLSNAQQAIAIFDASIEGHHHLIAGLHPHIIPYILPSHGDGIRTLTQRLQQYNHPLTVYLVTHGAPGSLQLGNTELNLTALHRYAEELGSWFQNNSELFLYACNVAAGDAGDAFLSKLHQLTGASIAASARRVGNVQQGGTWALDVVAGDMAIALPFTAATMAHYPGTFPLAITGINAAYDDVPDNTTTYTADEVAEIDNPGDGIENYTYNFPVGTENNLIISGFDVGADSFGLVQLVEQVRIERRDNAVITGDREIFWYERESLDTTNNVLNLKSTQVSSLEEALLSPTINRGADNIFANQGDTNVNDIERVDFVETGGISAPALALDDIGFLLLERSGNDPITIAPITAIDVDGTPTAYGTLQTFAPGAWGNSGFNIETAVLNDLGTGSDPGVSATPGAQSISGIFVSFTDLGIGANQRFFGYSVFPGDVETDLVGLTDANLDTNSAQGGLDLIASGALFLRNGANVPPILDLDPSNTTGGADNGNFETTFTSGGVDITAPNATGFDPGNGGADIETLTITVDVFDGANEILQIGGTSLQLTNGTATTVTVGSTTFNVGVTATGGTATVTVTNNATGDISNGDIRQFLRSLSYNNTSATANTTPRVFSFMANDGVDAGNTVTSTISFNNTTPSLDLDPTNGTGGPDNGNFDTTFTTGGSAVEITADDATAIDPNNGGNDIETLTISVNTPDGADEVLNVAGTPVTLSNGTTQTVTFGSTTFDIAVTSTGSDATVTITNDTGGTIPNVDLRTLLRSLTYDNTSTNPDTTDRVFSFEVEDGEATSTPVTSTVSFGNNTPSLNIDPNNSSGGADDRNFDTTFTTGGSAVEITADDATVVDPDNGGNDVETLTISVNTPDGADEVLNFAGTPITLTSGTTQMVTFGSTTFDIAVTGTGSDATVTVTNNAGGTIPNVDLRTLLRSLTYDNTSTNPDPTDRVFSLEVEDDGGTSNTVTSTVSIDPPSNTTSILNLDPNNESDGPDNRNFDTTFTTGGSAVDLTADDATAIDPDNGGNDIETLTISVNTPDGGDEILNFAGTPITLTDGTTQMVTFGSTTFDIAVTGTGDNATITVTNEAGGTIPNTALRTLLRSLTYDNTSKNPDTTDRVFSFVVGDGESTSTPVTSTVSIIPPSNTTSVLNLDPTNESGGPNNRNFEATFTAGDGAVDLTDEAATAVDPDNNGADIERLSISVNVPDGPNEILSFGDTNLTLTNGATTTVTLDSTTFEVAVVVNNGTATVSIDSASGGDIPNTDLRTLLRSLTYSNTSATPDQADRVFTFIANDGLVNSNTVTSTISIDPGTDPTSCDCSCASGVRLAGNGTDNGLEGSPGRDIIRGLVGDDELMGLACPDRLIGAAGNDRLFGGGASDTLDGNIGRDYLSGQNGDDILFGGGERDRLNGGRGQDQLNGEAGSDYLRGKAGADQLRGGQGNDGMSGGAGRDRMFGGAGNDRMFGGGGRDRMRGNARADRVFGGSGDDRIFGQNGRDLLRGEAGQDILRGGAGNDRALGGAGDDRIFGGARHDVLIGGRGVDRVSGQRGNDQLRGGRLGDRLSGSSGDDLAAGGKGNDRVLGGSGSDTLSGNKGADRILGGTGRDQLRGGRGNDRIDGGAQNDVIRGHFGADVLLGKAGFDTLKGGRRRDRIRGGAGKDRLFGGKGNDRIDGAAQNDTVRGNKGADVVFGKEGRDFIRGDRGFDRLNGGRDNDTLNGGGAADTLLGKARHDRLEGVAGKDRLFGNNGRDTLVGGSGNDLLVGGADGDILRGGQGADRFAFNGVTANAALRDSLVEDADRILDFDQTEGDRFAINVTRGAAAVPSALFNGGQVVGSNLEAAATQAFRDRNPNQAGNQRIGARQAVLFDWRQQSYLLVNNGNRSFNATQDLVVNVTGIELKARDANRVSLTVNDYFA
ncbi:MAG: DUF4347 domain-containing protein [Cyanobacteria bacterium J06638_22]